MFAAIADPVRENAERRRGDDESVVIYDDYRTMIAEAQLDAVDICLPHHLHAEAIIAAAEAGLHVLCEKPLCLTVDEAAAITEVADRTGVTIMCAHNQLFFPPWPKRSGCWTPGSSGRVYEVRTTDSFYNDFTPESMGWRAHAATAGGGELIDTGYHPLYLLQHLAGATPVEVTAMLSKHRLEFMEGEDSAQVLVRFDNGVVGHVTTSWAYDAAPGTEKFSVVAERGSLTSDGVTLTYRLRGEDAVTVAFEPVHDIAAEVAHFAECLAHRRAPDPDPRRRHRRARGHPRRLRVGDHRCRRTGAAPGGVDTCHLSASPRPVRETRTIRSRSHIRGELTLAPRPRWDDGVMSDRAAAAEASPARRTSPARQVLTLFGDYWWDVSEPMPSGALVAAMIDLGVKEPAARATTARLTRTGLLVQEKVGRRTTHRLSERAVAIVAEEATWLDRFGCENPQWDGLWTVLAFSIPESQRALRHTARSRLKWAGFAPLYDGVWISPGDSAAQTMAQLQDAGVGSVTAMRATLETSLPAGAQGAWDLAAAAALYDSFRAELESVREPAADADALAQRSKLMLTWQGFRAVDVGLPVELLPPAWPRFAVRRLLASRYDDLGPSAEERMRQHVSAIAPELAAVVTSRRLSTAI